jgi:polysaccharide biosynthesis transport protein
VDVFQHLRLAWHRRWLVLALALLCAVVTYGVARTRPSSYTAHAVVGMSLVPPGGGQFDTNTVGYLTRSYANLATTKPVLDRAITIAGLHLSDDAAATMVSAEGISGDGLITITVSNGSASTAQALAQGVANALVAQTAGVQGDDAGSDLGKLNGEVSTLSGQLAASSLVSTTALQNSVTATYTPVIGAATTRQAVASPPLSIVSAATTSTGAKPAARYALLAFVAGLVVAAEGLVVGSAVRGRLSPDDLDEDLGPGLSILARVPRVGDAGAVDALRALRSRVAFILEGSGGRTVTVTGVGPRVGASFTALNLAEAFTDMERSVWLVDADLRRSAVGRIPSVPGEPGLTEALRRDDPVPVAPTQLGPRLWVLGTGHPVEDPAALLTTRLHETVFAVATADLIIVDTPPVTMFADGLAVAAQTDATIVVAALGTTHKQDLTDTIDKLRLVNAHVIGVVVTEPTHGSPRHSRR